MIALVVYADILIAVNLIVDYFLLLATARLLCREFKLYRIVLSALIGGISALYIFLPQASQAVEGLTRAVICFIMAFVAFGYKNLRLYLKSASILFLVTCGYAGVMIAIWHIFKPNGMIVNNSVVYFNISPVILVCSTLVFYIIFIILSRIFKSSSVTAEKCDVMIFAGESKVKLLAIVDTGNSIEDVFGISQVIISDKAAAFALFGDVDINTNENLKSRYRLIPCSTVTGGDVLEGYRCDRAEIFMNERKLILNKPLLAVSKIKFDDEYNAIVNPKIFT